MADTPLGWINSGNQAAYTTTRGEIEVGAAAIAVNDTIDIFNYRDDLISGNRRLVGDSGDLSGHKFELHYGITEDLSIFLKRQKHSLSLDLGEIQSVDLANIDTSLNTLAESAGIKWTFYRANILNPDNRHTAASLELSVFSNKSTNFDIVLNQIRLSNLTIYFGIPQTFSVAKLNDDGWKTRLIYSWPIQDFAVGTLWAGLGAGKANSATTSDLQSISIRKFFEQSFGIQEKYRYLGASLGLNITPRLSISVNYEFIKITDSKLSRFPASAPIDLPSILTASPRANVDNNHTVDARIAYWLTPRLNLSFTGKLFSNQFVGLLPHYNNPLSGSFSSIPYGFAGLELVYKYSLFH